MNTGHGIQRQPRNHLPFFARDPRFLILAFAMIIAAALFAGDTRSLVVVLIYVLVLYRAAGVPAVAIVRHVKSIVVFVMIILIANSLLIKGEPLIPDVPFVSFEGFTTGVHYGVRFLVLYFSVMLFLSVTSPEAIAKGIAAALKPFSPDIARRAALHSFVSVGFLPLFGREIQRIRVAQRFRGGGIDGGLFNKINGVRLLLVPLILSAIQRSAQLAMVVELRNIPNTIGPLLELEPVSRRDYFFVLVTCVILLAAVWVV